MGFTLPQLNVRVLQTCFAGIQGPENLISLLTLAITLHGRRPQKYWLSYQLSASVFSI